MRHLTGRGVDLDERSVAIGETEHLGHRCGEFPIEALPVPTCHVVDRVADVQQPLVCRVHFPVRPVGQPRRGERSQHDHVAQTAPRLFEVGRQHVRGVAEALVPRLDRVDHLAESTSGGLAPVVSGGLPGGVDHRLIPGDDGQIEQADRGREVRRGDVSAFADGAH